MQPRYSILAAGILAAVSNLVWAAGTAQPPQDPEANQAPVACFDPKDAAQIKLGDAISFDASCSTDADGQVAGYAWKLDGQDLGSDKIQSVTFAEQKDYRLSLVVTDDKNQASRPVLLQVKLAPVLAQAYQGVNLRGSFNRWGKLPMKLTANNVWTAEVKLDAKAEFKFDTVPGDWTLSFGDNEADGIAESAEAKNIVVANAGFYRVTFNDLSLTYQLEALTEQPEEGGNGDDEGNGETGEQATCTKPEQVEGAIAQGDFNGDGKADLLWRNSETGQNALWQMDSEAVSKESLLDAVADTDWQVADLADLNGDNKTDVLWRHPNGQTAAWLMDGEQHQTEDLPSVPSEWKLSAADLDGDKKAELIWRNENAQQTYVWQMRGNQLERESRLPDVPADWEISGLVDADGDGKADITWRNPTKGMTAQWFMKDAASFDEKLLTPIPADWQLLSAQDNDGDGKADLLWRHAQTNHTVLLVMDKAEIKQEVDLGQIPSDWQVSNTGDLDGDKKADILWRHQTTGQNALATDVAGKVQYRDVAAVANKAWRLSGDGKCKGKDWRKTKPAVQQPVVEPPVEPVVTDTDGISAD